MTLGTLLALALLGTPPTGGAGSKGQQDVSVIMMAATSVAHFDAVVAQFTKMVDDVGGGYHLKVEPITLHTRFRDDPHAVMLTSPKLPRPVVLLESHADATESVILVALLEAQYHVVQFVYGGSCGMLVNDHATLDVMVPSTLLRSDLEYDDVDGKTLVFPEWKNQPLIGYYQPSYKLDLSQSPLVQGFPAEAGTQLWKDGVAAILKPSHAPAAVNRTSVGMATGGIHVTGGHFIAGIPARQRYHRVFGADSVDMRAMPIVVAAHDYGTDVAAVMSCSDMAGSDHPDDAMETFAKNIDASYQLALYTSFLAVAKP